MKKQLHPSPAQKGSRIRLSCASHLGRRRFFSPEVVYADKRHVEVRMLFPLPVGSHVELAAGSTSDSSAVGGQAEVAHCRCGKGGLFEIGLRLAASRAKAHAATRV